MTKPYVSSEWPVTGLARFRTSFSLEEGDKEHPSGVSMTVQKDVMSLKEMLARAARGQRIPDRVGVFDDEDESDEDSYLEDVDKEKALHLDPVEQQELLADIKEKQDRYVRQEKLKQSRKYTPSKKTSGSASQSEDDTSVQERDDASPGEASQKPPKGKVSRTPWSADEEGGAKRSKSNTNQSSSEV